MRARKGKRDFMSIFAREVSGRVRKKQWYEARLSIPTSLDQLSEHGYNLKLEGGKIDLVFFHQCLSREVAKSSNGRNHSCVSNYHFWCTEIKRSLLQDSSDLVVNGDFAGVGSYYGSRVTALFCSCKE
ncbi:uncharacterized protein RAG0_06048 [Rhynchosporium agropyri]|uniref:Uncharacterized protein n=1 Tax=Rhynchosporium agropyri TaxID=914238 RepID=A0A1E1KFN7_9HELO|nr:uncharacterized protein RAG0_06048 [Rhynchosporium agropyri]